MKEGRIEGKKRRKDDNGTEKGMNDGQGKGRGRASSA